MSPTTMRTRVLGWFPMLTLAALALRCGGGDSDDAKTEESGGSMGSDAGGSDTSDPSGGSTGEQADGGEPSSQGGAPVGSGGAESMGGPEDGGAGGSNNLPTAKTVDTCVDG